MPGKQPPDVKQEREQYMLGIFLKDPDLSMEKAQKEFSNKYGDRIRNKRVYELRDVARAQLKGKVKPPTPSAVAAAPEKPKEKITRAAREPKDVGGVEAVTNHVALIEGDTEKLAWFEKTISSLRSQGFNINVAVDHRTDAYLVLRS